MLGCDLGITHFGQQFLRFTNAEYGEGDVLINTAALIHSVVQTPTGSTIIAQFPGHNRDYSAVTETYKVSETPTQIWAQLKAWDEHMQAVLKASAAQRQLDEDVYDMPGVSRPAIVRAHQRRMAQNMSSGGEQAEPPAMPAPWDPFAQRAASA